MLLFLLNLYVFVVVIVVPLDENLISYSTFSPCRWLPKSAMRPVGPDTSHNDCILVVGVSRPKLAVAFLTVMLISLFLTFHVLYDSAVYNIQAAQAVHEHRRLALINSNGISGLPSGVAGGGGGGVNGGIAGNGNRFNHLPEDYTHNNKHADDISSLSSSASSSSSSSSSSLSTPNQQISHPMVFPSNRVHFPKTSRRLPQVSCNTHNYTPTHTRTYKYCYD